MPIRRLATVIAMALCAGRSIAQSNSTPAAMDAYLQAYARSGNFAGYVLVEKSGRVIFEKAYGLANRERRIPNAAATRFHIASMSMQFTAAAVLRLVDTGSITLNDHAGDFVRGMEGADKINSKFLHEEHSAYNLLALIVEKKTGLRFAAAVERLVFRPMGLIASGVDDDSMTQATRLAKGYAPEGTYGLKPASAIHWSAKTGNASVYTTAGDETRWVNELFRGHALSAASREAVLDTSVKVGYGWFKSANKRFAETAYYMNGRAPGFSSFVLYLPLAQTTVVVLSNIYSAATTTIGYDIAALSLGLPYEPFHFRDPPPSPTELSNCTGTFQFGPDLYQANAKVTLLANGQELSLR